MDENTLTAPDGIFIRRRTGGVLHVSPTEQGALQAGFGEQACFRGMGELVRH